MIREFSFPRTRRLLDSSDFSAVFDRPTFKVHHQHFLIIARSSNRRHPRLGIIVAKKNVRLAVKRNRIKRIIRETFRNKQHKLSTIDAIVLARRGSEQLTNENILEILNGLWMRAAKKANKIHMHAGTTC